MERTHRRVPLHCQAQISALCRVPHISRSEMWGSGAARSLLAAVHSDSTFPRKSRYFWMWETARPAPREMPFAGRSTRFPTGRPIHPQTHACTHKAALKQIRIAGIMSSIAETYRRASEDELVALCAEIDSLTGEARDALRTEINRRGLSDEQVASQIETLKREQEEQKQIQLEAKRKRPVRWLLILAQIGCIFAAAAVAVLCLELINISPEQAEAAGSMFAYAMLFTLAVCLTWFRGKIWLTVAIAISIDAALLVFLRIFAAHP